MGAVSFQIQIHGGAGRIHHADLAPVSRLGGIGSGRRLCSVTILSLTVLGRPLTLESAGVVGAALAMFGLGWWDDLRCPGGRRELAPGDNRHHRLFSRKVSIQHFKFPLPSHIIDFGSGRGRSTVFLDRGPLTKLGFYILLTAWTDLAGAYP